MWPRTQGITAAKNMLGGGEAHLELPYFFSDMADWLSLEYVGRGSGEPVIRGSLDDGEFAAFYLDGDGRLTGGALDRALRRPRGGQAANQRRGEPGPGRAGGHLCGSQLALGGFPTRHTPTTPVRGLGMAVPAKQGEVLEPVVVVVTVDVV